MLNRKLLEVLRRLNESEQKRLRLFLLSPYFNFGVNTDSLLRLYDHILAYGAEEDHPRLEKEFVARQMFPDRPFQQKTKGPIDDLTSQLWQLVRQYLSQRSAEAKADEPAGQLALAAFYRNAGLEERFWQTIQTIRDNQTTLPYRDAAFFYRQFQIEEEEQLFRGLYNSTDNDVNLKAMQANLDLYYSIKRLEINCGLEHQQNRAQIDPVPTKILEDSIWALSDTNGPLDTPQHRIYRTILQLLRNPAQVDQLENLERLLDAHQHTIPLEQFKNLKTYSRIFILQQYQQRGDEQTRSRVFDLYNEHLQKGYFYIDGKIPFTAFRNLIVFALKLNKTEWVKHFLDTHTPDRIGGTRFASEIYSLNLAEYQYHLAQYDEAQNTLVYRHFEHPGTSITADLLLIKIFYETQQELLAPRMKALDQKIRRSSLASSVKERNLNFLRKLDKIIKYGWQKKSGKRLRLIEEIKSTPQIVAREWLLEKLGSD